MIYNLPKKKKAAGETWVLNDFISYAALNELRDILDPNKDIPFSSDGKDFLNMYVGE